MAGLFSTFNIATRGMSVQQKAIDVTSHNISNANTEGYSRQRAKIETTTPYTDPSINRATGAGQMGTGAQVSAIERYRDTFIDYQIRTQTSTKGQYDTIQTQLGEVESIFNEPTDTGFSAVLTKFFSSWQDLSKAASSSEARTTVAQSAASLADDLNDKYNQMMKLKQNVQTEVQNSVYNINSQLNQISKLNQQIKAITVSGDTANDLMDKRDLLLDNLSEEFNINVTKTDLDGISVAPVDTNGVAQPNMVSSVDNGTDKRLSYISSIEGDSSTLDPLTGKEKCTITYYSMGDISSASNKHTITVSATSDEMKSIDENRVLWTNTDGIAIDSSGSPLNSASTTYTTAQLTMFQPSDGNLKGYTAVQQDVDSYVDQLNNVAKTLAFSVNAIHSGLSDPGIANVPPSATASTSPVNYDAMPFFVNSDTAQYSSSNVMSNLAATLGAEQNITAGNISINKQILSDVSQIKTRKNDYQYANESSNTVDGEADGARALAIAGLANALIKVSDVGSAINSRADLFAAGENTLSSDGLTFGNNSSGATVSAYFKDIVDVLGTQSQEAQRVVTNQNSLLANFQNSKASISGVSLDEEMSNLIQYQHAYQANAKVISTLDELLDVVVNGLKK